MTNSHQCFKPIPVLIGELKRHLKGWANYVSLGYPMSAYCEIDGYIQDRLIQHLQRCPASPSAATSSLRSEAGTAAGCGAPYFTGSESALYLQSRDHRERRLN